jgi:hypothetical protein
MKKGSTVQWLKGAKEIKDGETGRGGENEMSEFTDF